MDFKDNALQSNGGLLARIIAKRHPGIIKDKKMKQAFKNIIDICKDSMSGEYFALIDTLLGDVLQCTNTETKEDFLPFDTPTTKVVGFLFHRVPHDLVRLYHKAIGRSLTHSPQA